MRKLNILVVDDDRDNANSLGELFDYEGHNTQVVYSGKEAIFAYLQMDFDMAFVDVMMPGLNGVQSFLEIRKLRPQAKVFMMSGYSVEELLKQAINNGALGMLNKPVAPETLLQSIEQQGPNGLVVAPRQEQNFHAALKGVAQSKGKQCEIVTSVAALQRGRSGGDLLVLDIKQPLIDSMGLYSTLRQTHDMPPTAILAPAVPGVTQQVMRDMRVTGILNKPFDPVAVLSHLESLAA
jgi:two-component system response regulator HydG